MQNVTYALEINQHVANPFSDKSESIFRSITFLANKIRGK
jgi:hypothetical protein